MTTENAADVWRQQKRWSVAAGNLKTSITRSRYLVLILWIGGAFLETLATQVPVGWPQRLCAALGAVFLAVVSVLTYRVLTADRTRAWVRARSASEGLKAEAYMYGARAAPYDGAAKEAGDILRKRASDIREQVEDLSVHAVLVETQDSEPPGPLTANEYIAKRVDGQIENYYRPKARENARSARLFRIVETVLAVVAAVVAALATAFGGSYGFGAWVAVLTTIGGAVTAHVASCRFEYLVTSYAATAQRLEDLRSQWPPSETAQVPSPEWSEYVRQCENAISVENQSWMAKWTQKEKKAADEAQK
jgi:hypothetical protein